MKTKREDAEAGLLQALAWLEDTYLDKLVVKQAVKAATATNDAGFVSQVRYLLDVLTPDEIDALVVATRGDAEAVILADHGEEAKLWLARFRGEGRRPKVEP